MRNAVLVLGASGFIGRHLAETIALTGRDVIAATRTPATFRHAGITNVVAPFDSASQFSTLLQRSGAVVHAASSSTPGSSAAQPQLDGNLRTTLALIEALQDHPDQQLLYLSSGGTLYGDRDRAAREDDPLRPRSYHGAGKAAAEHFIHAWAMQYDATAVLLRPSNVYGRGQLARQGFGIVPTAFNCALRDIPLTVWGSGETVRDYLHVDDLVSLCQRALTHSHAPGVHVYNASRDHGMALNDLLDDIDGTTERPLQRHYQPARRVDVGRIVPDNQAARNVLGWQPQVDLAQGLQDTWRWFISHS
ncbi:MAG: NAD-dependent epimerase/dehydratase family protein [Luteimonas sp.]